MEDPSPMTSEAPEGEQLCEFVPQASVVQALGTEDFDIQGGQVSRDSQGALSGAACRVTAGDDVVLSVMVDFMLGHVKNAFVDGLTDDEYNQLPDEQGLGYSWTEGADGSDEHATGEARLSRGDYIIETEVVGIADGRDPGADAMALAQQVTRTLEIPDTWTLPEAAPSR